MDIEDRIEFRAKNLFEQIGNKGKLNYHTPNHPKNMLKNSLQHCKSFVKLSAIGISTISMLLTGQPEKAEAAINPNILNSFLSKSSQSVLNWESNFIRKSKFFALKRNLLSTLDIHQNNDKNISSQSSSAKSDEQVNTIEESAKNNYYSILSKTTSKDYIFGRPSLTIAQLQQEPSYSNLQQQSIFGLDRDFDTNSQFFLAQNIVEQIHIVKRGDTLNNIARLYGISRQELIEYNNIQNPNLIFVSQQIKIPQTKAQQSWEITAKSIPEVLSQNQNQVDNSSTQSFLPNLSKLDSSENSLRRPIQLGDESKTDLLPLERFSQLGDESKTELPPLGRTIQLSGEKTTELPPLERPSQVGDESKTELPPLGRTIQLGGENNTEISALGRTIQLTATRTPELPPLASPEQYLPKLPKLPTTSPAKFDGYIWPAKGILTSGFGWRWGRPHRGVDVAGPIGTPIVAAASGEVIFAGWNSGGFGNLVKIKHSNGSVTLYAHNHKIMVRRGQKVKQGQQIAKMGSTGFSTGSHLHFEIRPNGRKSVNPMAYLPKR